MGLLPLDLQAGPATEPAAAFDIDQVDLQDFARPSLRSRKPAFRRPWRVTG